MDSQQNRLWLPVLLFVLLLATAGSIYAQNDQDTATAAPEQPVILLAMEGPISDRNAELSGLAWHGETLILLPQYPELFGSGDGALFSISRQELIAALDSVNSNPLQPTPIKLMAPGLRESIPGFQGFEAIGFYGDQVFVTVEASQGNEMRGYLVGGRVSSNMSEILLDKSSLVEIPLPIQSSNHSDEALVIMEDKVITFFEINGSVLNPNPVAHIFGLDLLPQGALAFPSIEYRITDMTLASDGTLWAINYFFPGDTDLLPQADPIRDTYGAGQTHMQYDQVERLVAFRYETNRIILAGLAPVQLRLEAEDANNWEGLVMLDGRGFLLVTDKFPGTLLGFVELP